MRLLQRYSLVQHGVNLPDVLKQNSMSCDQIEVIYSPFLIHLCWPNVPQLITCHDLTLWLHRTVVKHGCDTASGSRNIAGLPRV